MATPKLVHMNTNKTNYGVARQTKMQSIEVPIDVKAKPNEDQIVDVYCPGCETEIKVQVTKIGEIEEQGMNLAPIFGVIFLISLVLRIFVFTTGILATVLLLLTITCAIGGIATMPSSTDPYYVIEAPEESQHGIQTTYEKSG